jgi:hypothetical protein
MKRGPGGSNVRAVGLFRIRVARDGAVDIWAKGWRLESQVLALVPVLIAAGFLFSPFPMPVRAFGAALLLVCAWIVLRMTRLGFRVDLAGVQVTDVARTHRVVWDRFDGFVGERNEHEGRCVLLTTDGERLPSPGTLDPDEMDPFWSEGDISAVDQLNRLVARARQAQASGTVPGPADLAEPSPAGAGDDGLGSPGARRLRSIAGG